MATVVQEPGGAGAGIRGMPGAEAFSGEPAACSWATSGAPNPGTNAEALLLRSCLLASGTNAEALLVSGVRPPPDAGVRASAAAGDFSSALGAQPHWANGRPNCRCGARPTGEAQRAPSHSSASSVRSAQLSWRAELPSLRASAASASMPAAVQRLHMEGHELVRRRPRVALVPASSSELMNSTKVFLITLLDSDICAIDSCMD
mmetsp:Transcript_65789/g.177723  ORF Transcript_65789/g.177723 Transcript_65789/m.177723 type:complete len:204 (-) Transcript_65789:87-698(-)